MGKEMEAAYYDSIYETASNYHADYSDSHYLPLYKVVADYLSTTLNHKILEIGCGTGQLANYLGDLGYTDYIGFDFSEVAIEKAKEMCTQKFFVGNALSPISYVLDYNIVLAIEILEHLDKDLEVLSSIKSGTEVILSFPTFTDPSHVRHFKTPKDIIDRYEKMISFNHIEPMLPWHVARGVIR